MRWERGPLIIDLDSLFPLHRADWNQRHRILNKWVQVFLDVCSHRWNRFWWSFQPRQWDGSTWGKNPNSDCPLQFQDDWIEWHWHNPLPGFCRTHRWLEKTANSPTCLLMRHKKYCLRSMQIGRLQRALRFHWDRHWMLWFGLAYWANWTFQPQRFWFRLDYSISRP